MHPDTVLDLLRTHSAAEPAQLQEIHRSAKHYESELASWQTRLEAALILVNVLQQKVNDTARKKRIFSSYISPIHTLPAEILEQIFVDACAEDHHFDPIRHKKDTGPLTSHTLVRVCKFWRDIALQKPGIWRHYVVIRPASEKSSIFQVVHLSRQLREVVNFYGQNLTQLYLQLPAFNRPEFHPIRAFALERRDQFKALKLVGNVFAGLPTTMEFPALDELLLCVDSNSFELSSVVTFRGPMTKLSIYYPQSALHRLELPWQQISYLSFGFPFNLDVVSWPLEHILEILQALLSLIELHLTGVNIDYPVQALSKLVTLPRLRILELNDCRCSVAGPMSADMMFGPIPIDRSLLAHLRTPLLEHFDWIVQGNFTSPSEYSLEKVNHFLRSASHLRMLRVAFCDFNPNPRFRGGHILRLIGSRRDFGALRGARDLTCEDVIALASQKKYPNEISPHLVVGDRPVVPVDYFIDRILEDGKFGAYAPVGSHFDWPNVNDQSKEGRRRLDRLAQTHMTSDMVFSGLFGADDGEGPVNCERRLYITI